MNATWGKNAIIHFMSADQYRPRDIKIPFTPETKEWTPNLDAGLPIEGKSIPGFKAWINWNGFRFDKNNPSWISHRAFDFAAYLTQRNEVVLGLPQETEIRAVADGHVTQVSHGFEIVSNALINIEHGKKGSGVFSSYGHIVPLVEQGTSVKKGDLIATLYKAEGTERGPLVHLHFELTNAWEFGDYFSRVVDPGILDLSLYRYNAVPQSVPDFRVAELPEVQDVKIAHFQELSTISVEEYHARFGNIS